MCEIDAIKAPDSPTRLVIFEFNTLGERFALEKASDLRERLRRAKVVFTEKPSSESIEFFVNNEVFKKLCRLGFRECRRLDLVILRGKG